MGLALHAYVLCNPGLICSVRVRLGCICFVRMTSLNRLLALSLTGSSHILSSLVRLFSSIVFAAERKKKTIEKNLQRENPGLPLKSLCCNFPLLLVW